MFIDVNVHFQLKKKKKKKREDSGDEALLDHSYAAVFGTRERVLFVTWQVLTFINCAFFMTLSLHHIGTNLTSGLVLSFGG